MAGWRAKILQHFTPQISKLTLAADPDGILLEEGILSEIRERGFELLPFDDHIAFRYAYESKYRSKWDRGDSTELVVVLRSESQELSHLPFDIFQAGRKLSFSLTDLFPNLSYPILRSMDPSYLDDIDDALGKFPQPNLGDKASCDFILRHVFYIVPEIINNPSELLHVLVRKHYQRLIIPSCLEERFLEILSLNTTFKDWPLKQIVPKREKFFFFLQERWPIYLERLNAPDPKEIKMPLEKYGLEFSGPKDLPFGHDDIRVYIDNLFLEGMLKPVVFSIPEKLAQKWVSVGILSNEKTPKIDQLKKLIHSVESSIPEVRSFYHEWISFALKWANLETVKTASEKANIPDDVSEQYETLRETIDNAFVKWLFHRYAGLYNQPSKQDPRKKDRIYSG